jgi:hypothetical protein
MNDLYFYRFSRLNDGNINNMFDILLQIDFYFIDSDNNPVNANADNNRVNADNPVNTDNNRVNADILDYIDYYLDYLDYQDEFEEYLDEFKFPNSNCLNIPSNSIEFSSIESECSICLDTIKINDKIIKLNCVHFFHSECITQWCKECQTCPLCRVSFEVKLENSAVDPSG